MCMDTGFVTGAVHVGSGWLGMSRRIKICPYRDAQAARRSAPHDMRAWLDHNTSQVSHTRRPEGGPF